MKKQMQKPFIIILVVALIFSQSFATFAEETTTQLKKIQMPKINKEAFAYLRPDIKIKMDDKMYIFFDANGKNVYPIIYGNRTYLPLRGISAMLDKNIAWESSNKTIYIGKTLDYPYNEKKVKNAGTINEARQIATDRFVNSLENRQITVNIRNDIRVLYNFEEKLGQNSEYYSLNYNWTNYLPIRAVSEMLGLKIEWDPVENMVIIGSMNGDKNDSKEGENDRGEESKVDLEKEKLIEKERREQFKKVAEAEVRELDELHKRATENLVALRRENNEETQKMYAEAVAQICTRVEFQKNSSEVYKRSIGSDQEKALIEAIKEYNEMLYHYTLVMENISYLAVAGQDFSMLSETFVEFAVQTQNKRQKLGTLLEEMQ